MKKSLIFWFAAVTCAAWILVGCESPTNGEKGAAGANAPGTLPSGATPAMLAALFETTDTVIVGLPLGEGTFTVPAGKTLAVAGTVDISGVNTVINAFDGTLDVSAGGFTADEGNVFIVDEAAAAAVKAAAPSGIVPAYVASIPATPSAITEDVVLPGLSIGGSGTSATDFVAFAGSANTVYVAGDVTIDASSAVNLTGAKLVVLGRINAAGAGPLTLDSNQEGSLTATGNLTLAGVSNLAGLNTDTYMVTSSDTTVDLERLDSGNAGKLVLSGAVTSVVIGGGTGNVELSSATLAFSGSTAASFGNTGTTAFTNAAGVSVASTGGITFDGPVSFAGDLTLTNVPATFKSIASFADTKSLKTTAAGSVVTLGPGAALAVAGYQSAWAHILANYGDGNVTLTPSSVETSLTFTKGATANARGITQKPTESGNHSIATTGAVSLVAGSAYTVNSASGSVGTLTVTSDTLSIQDGLLANDDGYDATANNVSAKLVLTGAVSSSNGAKLTGAGSVIAGGTTIVPSDNGWEVVESAGASPGTITIEADTITASTTTASLTGKTGGSPTITVAAGHTLTISTDTVVDLGIVGTLTLTGAASDGAQLAGAGEVKVGNASITGGATGAWEAVGDSTSIAFNATAAATGTITGTGTTPKLVGTDDTALITLAKGSTNGDAIALTVTNATIDLTAGGGIVFPWVGTTAASLVLKGGTDTLGALKLGTGITTNSNAHLTSGGHSVEITGTTPVIQGATGDADAAAGLISGGAATPGNDATITGKTASNDVTVKAGATLATSET